MAKFKKGDFIIAEWGACGKIIFVGDMFYKVKWYSRVTEDLHIYIDSRFEIDKKALVNYKLNRL